MSSGWNGWAGFMDGIYCINSHTSCLCLSTVAFSPRMSWSCSQSLEGFESTPRRIVWRGIDKRDSRIHFILGDAQNFVSSVCKQTDHQIIMTNRLYTKFISPNSIPAHLPPLFPFHCLVFRSCHLRPALSLSLSLSLSRFISNSLHQNQQLFSLNSLIPLNKSLYYKIHRRIPAAAPSSIPFIHWFTFLWLNSQLSVYSTGKMNGSLLLLSYLLQINSESLNLSQLFKSTRLLPTILHSSTHPTIHPFRLSILLLIISQMLHQHPFFPFSTWC